MTSFSLPKTAKIHPKIDPKRHQFFDRFLDGFFLDFGSILGPNLGPCWHLFRLKWRDPNWRPPLFLLGLCWSLFSSVFGPTGPSGTPPPGSILDGFWAAFSFHLGAKLALGWALWALALGSQQNHIRPNRSGTLILLPYDTKMPPAWTQLPGLVGLREAKGIILST